MLIVGNWKMHKGPDETAWFCRQLAERVADLQSTIGIGVCPPFISLEAAVREWPIVYAQNVHWENEGAYTGEISAHMLNRIGVWGTLVGHSERRQYFGESDLGVARRARAALDAELTVIGCVGETLEAREAGDMELVLKVQVEAIAFAVGAHDRLVLAYEPVWAIGTGQTATPAQAQEAHAFIKGLLDVPILYGGSVKPDNVEPVFGRPDVDGALVGGASLDVDSFTAICEAAARSRS